MGLVWSFFLDLSLILKSDSSFGHTNPICDPEGPPNPILDPEDPIQPDSILWDMNNLYFRSVIKSTYDCSLLNDQLVDKYNTYGRDVAPFKNQGGGAVVV